MVCKMVDDFFQLHPCGKHVVSSTLPLRLKFETETRESGEAWAEIRYLRYGMV